MAEVSPKALLVIDTQVNMFDESLPVYDADGMISRIGGLIEQARAAGVPVIYIQNNGPQGDVDEPGTPGWEILPALKPQPTDIVIEKTTPDSFHQTSLQAELATRGVKELVIAGMQTEWCIQTTSRQAVNLGFAVTLVRDGHSTFDSKAQTAPEVIAEYNRQLVVMATLKEAAQISF
jgi:nicotinamidase-related amidase